VISHALKHSLPCYLEGPPAVSSSSPGCSEGECFHTPDVFYRGDRRSALHFDLPPLALQPRGQFSSGCQVPSVWRCLTICFGPYTCGVPIFLPCIYMSGIRGPHSNCLNATAPEHSFFFALSPQRLISVFVYPFRHIFFRPTACVPVSFPRVCRVYSPSPPLVCLAEHVTLLCTKLPLGEPGPTVWMSGLDFFSLSFPTDIAGALLREPNLQLLHRGGAKPRACSVLFIFLYPCPFPPGFCQTGSH